MTVFLLGLLIGFFIGLACMARSIRDECEFGLVRFGQVFYKTIKTDPRKPLQ